MMLHRLRNDMIVPSDRAEQMENAEAADPIEPIERTEPIEPIESTEPREAIERVESWDQSDHFEVLARASTCGSYVGAGNAGSVTTVIVSTMNDLPGYTIEEVFGEVFGLTVRSRNVGSTLGAVFKSLVGGELKGMTKMLASGRQDATDRLVQEAEGLGANAVIAFRFDTSELGSTWTEICAYGTAVTVKQKL